MQNNENAIKQSSISWSDIFSRQRPTTSAKAAKIPQENNILISVIQIKNIKRSSNNYTLWKRSTVPTTPIQQKLNRFETLIPQKACDRPPDWDTQPVRGTRQSSGFCMFKTFNQCGTGALAAETCSWRFSCTFLALVTYETANTF